MTERSDKKTKAALYLCRLIKCAFFDEAPGDLPEGVTLGEVYALARDNGVEGISAYGIRKGDFGEGNEVAEKWLKSIDTILFRQAYFDAERAQILAEMEKAGLSYLPLKGVRLAQYYPFPGMRSMGDNDILYGFVEPLPDGGYRLSPEDGALSRAKQIMTDIMLGRGYSLKDEESNHDAFHKKPFFNFEMHREIVPDYDHAYSYYVNPWKRAVKCDGSEFEYTFRCEDDYVYNMAHMYTHFSGLGCGLRHLVDEYIMDVTFGDSLDGEYLERELRAVGIFEFREKIHGVMKALFYGDPDDEQLEVILYLAGAGTYGNCDTVFKNAMDKIHGENVTGFRAKLRYIKRRLIMPPDMVKRLYPAFYGKPWLTPVLVVYRIGRNIFSGSGRLGRELKRLIRYKG